MTCEESANLISARVDGELIGGDEAVLDAHLAGCGACRTVLAEMELQDAALLRAFSPRQEAAMELANRISRVIAQQAAAVHPERAERSPGFWLFFPRIAGWAAAAAAGFVVAIIMAKSAKPPTTLSPAATLRPVAQLTLATGEVYAAPFGRQTWRPIQVGAVIDRGEAVRTADAAKCELLLSDGSCMRLNRGAEARFVDDRKVQVSAGQVWSALPPNAAPLCVSTGQTNVTAGGASNDSGAEFDLACAPHAATVNVHRGNVDVTGGGGARTMIHAGESLQTPSSSAVFACTAMADQVEAIQWQDDLLILKPGDDSRVIVRVNQLLKRVSTEQSTAGLVSPTEREIRAHGQSWSTAIACILKHPPKDSDTATRRTAARLLSDLASSSNVPDLIDLLADQEGEVRYYAATALRRLTRETLGYSPDQCAATRDSAAGAAWRKWWEENKSRYSMGK